MKVLFLDESGDHNLKVIDPQYPMFVLGGIIADMDYAEGPMTQALSQFKLDVFGRDDIVLHTADITRNRNGFEGMKDSAFRNLFYTRLNELMSSLQYAVVACAIHKDEYYARYGLTAVDPYLLSFGVLVEHFCFDVGNQSDGGIIIAERREPSMDKTLELAWQNIRINGTASMRGSVVTNRISSLDLRAKKDNIAGLQLADLVVSPIGRHILGKPDREDWRIVERKFRRSHYGKVEGYGLITLP